MPRPRCLSATPRPFGARGRGIIKAININHALFLLWTSIIIEYLLNLLNNIFLNLQCLKISWIASTIRYKVLLDVTSKVAVLRAAFFQLLQRGAAFGCKQWSPLGQFLFCLLKKNWKILVLEICGLENFGLHFFLRNFFR